MPRLSPACTVNEVALDTIVALRGLAYVMRDCFIRCVEAVHLQHVLQFSNVLSLNRDSSFVACCLCLVRVNLSVDGLDVVVEPDYCWRCLAA